MGQGKKTKLQNEIVAGYAPVGENMIAEGIKKSRDATEGPPNAQKTSCLGQARLA